MTSHVARRESECLVWVGLCGVVLCGSDVGGNAVPERHGFAGNAEAAPAGPSPARGEIDRHIAFDVRKSAARSCQSRQGDGAHTVKTLQWWCLVESARHKEPG